MHCLMEFSIGSWMKPMMKPSYSLEISFINVLKEI